MSAVLEQLDQEIESVLMPLEFEKGSKEPPFFTAGKLLDYLMRIKGYQSDEALAYAADTTRPNIQKIRSGMSGGSPALWLRLSQLLDYPYENFMRAVVGLSPDPQQPDPEITAYANEFARLDPDEREVVKSVVRLYLRRKEAIASHDEELLARVKAEMDAEARANLATEQAMREAEKKSTHNDESKEVKKS